MKDKDFKRWRSVPPIPDSPKVTDGGNTGGMRRTWGAMASLPPTGKTAAVISGICIPLHLCLGPGDKLGSQVFLGQPGNTLCFASHAVTVSVSAPHFAAAVPRQPHTMGKRRHVAMCQPCSKPSTRGDLWEVSIARTKSCALALCCPYLFCLLTPMERIQSK